MRDDHEEDEPQPRKQKKVRRRRAYVHPQCGGTTIVSGDDFTRLANPFTFVSQTYCASCGSFVGLGSVEWEDTGETISAYRSRLRGEAPLGMKLLGWVFGPLGGAAIGALIGWACTPREVLGPISGGVVGLFVVAAFLMPLLSSLVWGIDYRSKR
jgi:hypothetical protein